MTKVTSGVFDYDKIAEDHEKQIAKNKELRICCEVKGGIVIEQLKRYAEKLCDHDNCSAMVSIKVWCHKYGDGNDFNVIQSAYTTLNENILLRSEGQEDVREIGKAVDNYINQRKESEK
jgi:hypothetical protein